MQQVFKNFLQVIYLVYLFTHNCFLCDTTRFICRGASGALKGQFRAWSGSERPWCRAETATKQLKCRNLKTQKNKQKLKNYWTYPFLKLIEKKHAKVINPKKNF